jgi:hypothetical protein
VASDDGLPSGSVLSTSWILVSGPGTVVFANPSSLVTTATFSQSGAYNIRLTATDGVVTSNSDIVVNVNPAVVSDTQAPSIPLGITTTALSISDIKIDWLASSDNVAVSGYVVLRDGISIATTTNLTYTNTGLIADTSYSYSIYAFDALGNMSNKSVVSIVKTKSVSVPTPATNNNLLKNSSFETPGDNFWGFGGSKISENELSTDAVDGIYSLKWPYVNTANDLPTNSPYSSEYQNTLSYQPAPARRGY